MSYRKNGLRVLGLLVVAALGVMAFAAAGAQAATAEYVFNGALASGFNATVGGVQEERGTLLVKALNLEINCEEFEVLEGIILSPTLADASLLYKGCTALEMPPLTGKLEELPCHVSDVTGGSPSSLHITAKGVLLKPIDFASGDYGVLASFEVFVNFLSGTGCPLPLKSTVKGSVCALIEPSGANGNETVEPLILLSEAIQNACPEVGGVKDKILYGTNEAFIDGKAKLFLTGTHATETLGVLLF